METLTDRISQNNRIACALAGFIISGLTLFVLIVFAAITHNDVFILFIVLSGLLCILMYYIANKLSNSNQ